jgi:hypothetical protein
VTEDRPPRVNRCRKCEGLLVHERVVGDITEAGSFAWWRCVNCGACVDATIVRNKYRQPPVPPRVPITPTFLSTR